MTNLRDYNGGYEDEIWVDASTQLIGVTRKFENENKSLWGGYFDKNGKLVPETLNVLMPDGGYYHVTEEDGKHKFHYNYWGKGTSRIHYKKSKYADKTLTQKQVDALVPLEHYIHTMFMMPDVSEAK